MRIGSGTSGGSQVSWRGSRVELGGAAGAPPPLEMMLCALGACGFQAALSYCQTSGIDPSGLAMEQEIAFSAQGDSVERMEQRLILPGGFPEEAERTLLWMIENCPAAQLLCNPPEIKRSLCRGQY